MGFYVFEPHDSALFYGLGQLYGLGQRPDLTGRGLGEQFVLAGLEFARPIYGWRRVVLQCRGRQGNGHDAAAHEGDVLVAGDRAGRGDRVLNTGF